ncbi:MAG: glycosyltransferase, partial [Chlorobi bacterium]|nr:glycosyltransferase [Chlorobiota bacterium]
TIKSIIKQDFDDYEIIVVDGDSNNKDVEKVYSKYKKYITVLIKEPDKGIFDALNKGIKASNGDFLLLIGADDRLKGANVLKNVYKVIENNKDLSGICIECHFVNSKGKVIRKWVPSKITKKKIKWGILPPHFSLFLNKKVYGKIGLFDISKGNIGLDSLWLLQLTQCDNLNIQVLKGNVVLMELGGTSTGSLKNILIAYKKIALEAKSLNFKNWYLIPLIKVTSKLSQFIIK